MFIFLEVDDKGEYLFLYRGVMGLNGGSRWFGIDFVFSVNDLKVINSIYSVYGIESDDIVLYKNCVICIVDIL